MYWIPTLTLLLHVVEEFPTFPTLASRHFGTTSRAWYVYSHIVLIALSATVSARAHDAAAPTVWPVLALAIQCSLGLNALFHVTTALLFREYSPGVVTGVLVVLPAIASLRLDMDID